MAGHGVDKPHISRSLYRLFATYTRYYLKRSFHAVRLAGGRVPSALDGYPVVICANHPSWWDPLLSLLLGSELMARRKHYAPIDAAALQKYKFFAKLGFFPVEQQSARGAAAFLRVGSAILGSPESALWVTAQGSFADPRLRPVTLRPGVGHLVHRSQGVAVLPLAIEYAFWEERFPEALARFGDPLIVESGASRTAREWTDEIARRLESTQDLLAADVIARNVKPFEIVLGGRAGVGGVYDLWRAMKARLRGEHFERAHGREHL
jgi:1-acyl-sn-glycerol-3-phosphate acyltransferase